jgi:hypothetical protein
LFVPPQVLAGRTPKAWKPKEAQLYFDWLIATMDERVANLLAFFGEQMGDSAEELLERLGHKAVEIIIDPEYSEERIDTWKAFTERGMVVKRKTLTNRGYALGADFGLLIARLLISRHSTLEWTMTRKPKSDADYHQPVLGGWNPIHVFNPIRSGVGAAAAIARGDDDGSAFRSRFQKMDALMSRSSAQ